MSAWNIDADTIALNANWNGIPLVEDQQIARFLSLEEHDKVFFVIAPKGFGKTLMLKRKSQLYRDHKVGYRFIPRLHLCEKLGALGPMINFGRHELARYEDRSLWTVIWQLALLLTILHDTESELPGEISTILGSARSLNDTLNAILQQRKKIHSLSRYIETALAPALEKLDAPVALFIDNIDTVFERHSGTSLRWAQKANRTASVETWINGQLGLMDASLRLNAINKHVKVFASLRLEAFRKNEAATALQVEEYGCFPRYSRNQLKRIFETNIGLMNRRDLCVPHAAEPMERLTGATTLEHTYVREDAFDYIYRHTFARPRDIVLVGREIAARGPTERGGSEFHEAVCGASKLILESYKKEIVPFFPEETYEAAKQRIYSNILSQRELMGLEEDLTKDGFAGAFDRLYSMGMLGCLDGNPDESKGIQRFATYGEATREGERTLPASDYYFLHPAVAEEKGLRRGDYHYHVRNPIGYEMSFVRRFERPANSWHVHFGAGRLGLGLAVPVFSDVGRVVVCQRESPRWGQYEHGAEISVHVLNETFRFRVVRKRVDGTEWVALQKKDGGDILVVSNEIDVHCQFCRPATSMSTALGTSGLDWFVSIVRNLDLAGPVQKVNIYPMENDAERVKEVQAIVEAEQRRIAVVPVVVDRICSKLRFGKRRVDVTVEPYASVTVRGLNPEVLSLLDDHRLVSITEKDWVQEFYRRRKRLLVNGIHMMTAVLGYRRLRKYGVKRSEWRREAPGMILQLERKTLVVLGRMQIVRLMTETGGERVRDILHKNIIQSYDELDRYAKEVRERVRRTPDELGRLFNPKDRVKATLRYREMIGRARQFLNTRGDEIEALRREVEEVPKPEALDAALRQVERALEEVMAE